MIHLRRRVFSLLLHSPSRGPALHRSPIFSLLHLSSTITPIAESPFSIEDYLVTKCGLSPAQARKASKRISHVKSPSRADAVVAFLAGAGLSPSEVATVVTCDPGFLCTDVGTTLGPRLVELTDLGLSPAVIARLILVAPNSFRICTFRRNVEFWISVFGSLEGLLRVLKMNNSLLNVVPETVAKPNLAFLQRCGISATDLPNKFMFRMLARSPKHLEEALERVDEFGISRSSWVFPYALASFAIQSHEKLTMRIQMYEKLGRSRDDIALALSRAPHFFNLTEDKVKRNLEFLVREVGLDIPYIARRPILMSCSLERRLLPRHSVMKILKTRGLLNANYSFHFITVIGTERFLQRFVIPYEESVRGLTAAYSSSCNGKPQWECSMKQQRKDKELTVVL